MYVISLCISMFCKTFQFSIYCIFIHCIDNWQTKNIREVYCAATLHCGMLVSHRPTLLVQHTHPPDMLRFVDCIWLLCGLQSYYYNNIILIVTALFVNSLSVQCLNFLPGWEITHLMTTLIGEPTITVHSSGKLCKMKLKTRISLLTP